MKICFPNQFPWGLMNRAEDLGFDSVACIVFVKVSVYFHKPLQCEQRQLLQLSFSDLTI